MDAFPDGVLLVRSNRFGAWSEDSFRQDPVFFYLTGLENTMGAILALDGPARQTWLFVPAPTQNLRVAESPEALLNPALGLGLDFVRRLAEVDEVFRTVRKTKPVIYAVSEWAVPEPPLPAGASRPMAPLFARVLADKHHARLALADTRLNALMDIQSAGEHDCMRAAASASRVALQAGIRVIADGRTQRSVEGAVVKACLDAGARQSFWPWAMSGPNSDFPRPFQALGRYDHLDRVMKSGELVRLDIGCEVGHYQGDLGRTVPVSGQFDPAQREIWTAFVSAYRAGAKALRPGATGDSVYAAWREELQRFAPTVKTELARRAIHQWGSREGVPYWQVHTTGLVVNDAAEGLREGMTIDFEPIASIEGSGYFLEDMYLITHDGAELLTPGLPTTADEIELAMREGSVSTPP